MYYPGCVVNSSCIWSLFLEKCGSELYSELSLLCPFTQCLSPRCFAVNQTVRFCMVLSSLLSSCAYAPSRKSFAFRGGIVFFFICMYTTVKWMDTQSPPSHDCFSILMDCSKFYLGECPRCAGVLCIGAVPLSLDGPSCLQAVCVFVSSSSLGIESVPLFPFQFPTLRFSPQTFTTFRQVRA